MNFFSWHFPLHEFCFGFFPTPPPPPPSPPITFLMVPPLFYYINTNEIPSELSRQNMISSHVKRSLLLWLHSKITPLVPFVDSFSTEIRNFSSRVDKYFTRSLRSPLKYFQHSKTNFVSPRGHVISSITLHFKALIPKARLS